MKNLRNVCILAHVDHGKTSLADILISSNGYISVGQAGDIRYLDSRTDEQERGITMKSSIISLNYNYVNKLKTGHNENVIVNLIDSPGHVDFISEVSMAVRLSDCAFVVVDVIEGICSQTRGVIQQAWKEQLQMLLVLNKIDKMHVELKLTTTEAFQRLNEIIETIHHIIGELISTDVKELEENSDEMLPPNYINENYDTAPFHPLKGRVIFCSAYHHWGFRISDFINIYSSKLGIDKQELYKKMWGDYYMNSKKVIVKGASSCNRKNLFTSLILDQIWNIYDFIANNDVDKVENSLSKLEIDIKLNKRNKESSVSKLINIRQALHSWLPLHAALLDALVEKCPNPKVAMSKKKIQRLVPDCKFQESMDILIKTDTSDEAPVVVFIGKINLLNLKKKIDEEEDKGQELYEIIGLGRIYSGAVSAGLKVFVFTPRFNPYKVAKKYLDMTASDFEEGPVNLYDLTSEESDAVNGNKYSDAYVTSISKLYHFVGSEPVLLSKGARAGFIVGVSTQETELITKNTTLVGRCQLKYCLGMFCQLTTTDASVRNILCVSVEPKKVSYLNDLRNALYLLEKSDPVVTVSQADTGEMLLYVAGEVHLEKCLVDLETTLAPHIEIEVSNPIVPFRETVIDWSSCDLELYKIVFNKSTEVAEALTNTLKIEDNIDSIEAANQQGIKQSVVAYVRLPHATGYQLCCRVSVHCLPECLFEWIDKNYDTLLRYNDLKSRNSVDCVRLKEILLNSLTNALIIATEECKGKEREEDRINYVELLPYFWAVGENQYDMHNMLFGYMGERCGLLDDLNNVLTESNMLFYKTILQGFYRSMRAGPLCHEPVRGVIVILHNIWEMAIDCEEGSNNKLDVCVKLDTSDSLHEILMSNIGQFGVVMSKACNSALLLHPGIRLMIANYKLELEIRRNAFRSFSSLLNQNHGYVVQQDVEVGNFFVEARLPVVHSFGFGRELRSRTSGEVGLPQLRTISWEVLDCLPLLNAALIQIVTEKSNDVPVIIMEKVNRLLEYLNSVRMRKGLSVRKQLVEFADKQRTLSKKK